MGAGPIVEPAAAAVVVERNGWGERLGPVMQLPGSYVRDHVSLGYASTKDAAQGRTVDTGHSVPAPGMDLASLYVPLTRGRETNTVYVVTRHLAPDAKTGETLDAIARTPEDVLVDILVADRTDRSALAEQEAAQELAASMMTHLDRMADLIRDTNAGRLAATLDRLTADGRLTPHDRARIAADDAYGTLERLLRTAELAGHDPDHVLATAVTARGFDDATAPAQVLHHRITHRLTGRLTPHIRTGAADLIPQHLATDTARRDGRRRAAGGAATGLRRGRRHPSPRARHPHRHRRPRLGRRGARAGPGRRHPG